MHGRVAMLRQAHQEMAALAQQGLAHFRPHMGRAEYEAAEAAARQADALLVSLPHADELHDHSGVEVGHENTELQDEEYDPQLDEAELFEHQFGGMAV